VPQSVRSEKSSEVRIACTTVLSFGIQNLTQHVQRISLYLGMIQ